MTGARGAAAATGVQVGLAFAASAAAVAETGAAMLGALARPEAAPSCRPGGSRHD